MFYKKELNGNWVYGSMVLFPDGTELNENNKISIEGWEWSNEPPAEFIEWQESQEQEIRDKMNNS